MSPSKGSFTGAAAGQGVPQTADVDSYALQAATGLGQQVKDGVVNGVNLFSRLQAPQRFAVSTLETVRPKPGDTIVQSKSGGLFGIEEETPARPKAMKPH